jgi:hypothetical protein
MTSLGRSFRSTRQPLGVISQFYVRRIAPIPVMLILLISMIVSVLLIHSYENSLPIDMDLYPTLSNLKRTRKPVIPHTLWFTYKDNILETKEPNHLYENVLNTIAKYNESFRDQGYDEEFQVKALNDSDCAQLIEEAYPSLVPHFLDEQTGMYRGDICRVAALYLHGGYYFDLDMEVHTPYIAPSEGESPVFVTSYDAEGSHFFQSFLASTPKNPILKEALNATLEYYEGRNSECNKGQWCYIGVYTLKQGYDRVVIERSEVPIEKTLLLSEIKLEPHIYPDFPRRPGVDDRSEWFCNYVVHNPKTQIVHFYSRIPNTQNCP